MDPCGSWLHRFRDRGGCRQRPRWCGGSRRSRWRMPPWTGGRGRRRVARWQWRGLVLRWNQRRVFPTAKGTDGRKRRATRRNGAGLRRRECRMPERISLIPKARWWPSVFAWVWRPWGFSGDAGAHRGWGLRTSGGNPNHEIRNSKHLGRRVVS